MERALDVPVQPLGLLAMRKLLIVLTVAAAGATTVGPQASASGFTECAPPPNTFFTSLKVDGVGCRNARKVITKGDCVDPECRDTTYRSWRCHTKGGIAFRTTRCSSGERRIVATASGD